MVNQCILTIAIGTYNRSDILTGLIDSIIENKQLPIRIVVVDNCSTDNTVKALELIDDSRLRVYVNDKNYGGAYNILKAISYAKTKYCLYCNDRDKINASNLTDLIAYLEGHEFGVVYTPECDTHSYILEKGYQSIIERVAVHPTGMIYNMDVIRRNNIDIMSFVEYSKNIYTWCFLAREIMCYESAGYYGKQIWEQASDEFKKGNLAAFNKPVSTVDYTTLWFSPESQILQINGIVMQLKSFSDRGLLTEKDFYRASYRIFGGLYRKAIIVNRRIRHNSSECKHYGIEVKEYSAKELKEISCNQIDSFVRCIQKYRFRYKYYFYLILLYQKLKIFCYFAKNKY